jgi:hypothetical protein
MYSTRKHTAARAKARSHGAVAAETEGHRKEGQRAGKRTVEETRDSREDRGQRVVEVEEGLRGNIGPSRG